MGKNRHTKDRMFITSTEWKHEYGGHKQAVAHNNQPLPFDHCALSLAPFETPVCTQEGVMFDLLNLVPFVQQHKKNPVTGSPMATSDIIRLQMAKNSEGLWHCPVLFKVFNNNTHIVAIRTTGNVFCFEAVDELNLKAKNFTDLLTGEPFKKSDIITLQNPEDTEHMALRDISNFKHLQSMRDGNVAGVERSVRHNPTSERVLKELEKQQASGSDCSHLLTSSSSAAEYEDDVKDILALHPTTEDVNPGHMMTDQRASGALTSSAVQVHTKIALRPATAAEIREARWKAMRELGKKGYVQLQTSMGNINLEIHCDWSPRTAWNFITLCERGYYDNTKFHRLVPGFCIQGGDPTGTGSGGESAWGTPFKDEFDSRLVHDKRGVLSMANSGENTNGSQFFITMQATPHLDLKHCIFGRVVGGMGVVDKMEKVETNKNENPKKDIVILSTNVFVNPIGEADEALLEKIRKAQEKRSDKSSGTKRSREVSTEGPARPAPSVRPKEKVASAAAPKTGKYLPQTGSRGSSDEAAIASFLKSQGGGVVEDDGKKKMVSSSVKKGGFSNW
mmetsp:Transcript_1198/g.1951  ORF Transcript_1198/g.1951 Transcript_1198/m.1951 type:complete len:562 (+) Transcript_1198:133-1818(+)